METAMNASGMRDTRTQIEDLQVWSYRHLGRDPADLPRSIDLHRYRQREFYGNRIPAHQVHAWIEQQPEIEDPVYRRQMDEVYARFRTTPYQDPVILGGIAHGLDEISRAAQRLYPEEASAMRAPVAATVPISILNGFALEDDEGQGGIVLQDGLRFTPLLLASELAPHFLVEHPEGIGVDLDPDRVRGRLASDETLSDQFLSHYVRDVTEPNSYGLNPQRQAAMFEGAERGVYLGLQGGFQTFVVAHEFAHCLRRHVRQTRPDYAGPRWARHDEEVQAALDRAESRYASYPEPDREQLAAFRFTHALEFDADRVAFALLVDLLQERYGPSADSHMLVLGALSFFWYSEMLERVQRTVVEGNAWFGNPLYTEDLAVQGLLERPTHPAPLERGQALLSAALRGGAPDWAKQAALSSWHWLEALFETAWHTTRPVVAAAVRARGLGIDRKWIDQVPAEVAAIGIKAVRGSP
jgi:hypothetical protein